MRDGDTSSAAGNSNGHDGEATTTRATVVPVLSEHERNEILYAWNDTRADYPAKCAHELFEEQVERAPDAVAVVFEEQRLTYRELNQRANQVAHFLRKHGVGPETLVGVSLKRCPELVVGLLGVWKAGAAYVPLDPAYPPERLSFMVSDSAIRMLLTQSACKDLFPSANDKAVCLDSDWSTIAQEPTSNPGAGATHGNLAYVMYTSGSTGQPKGAMILHGGLVNYLWWAIKTYAVEAGGSVPVHSSISFDLTVTSLYPVLLAGGHAELLPEDIGAQNLLTALRRHKSRSLVKITPAHLELLSQQFTSDEAAGITNVFVIGGENLVAEGLQLWRDHAPATRLINEYGPTETVVGCCVYEVQPGDPRNGSVPIGRPIANTQLYILDPELQPVPIGAMGELYIGGAGVARGYLNRPELTQERFLVDRFSGREGARLYKTGDLARYRADKTLEYLGRVDNQVKVRGYRIELGEIEATLAGHPAVQSCAVLAREDSPGNKQLIGYLVPRQGESRAALDLPDFLKQRLPEYMVPTQFVLLDAFPLTQNGKVDRKALPAPTEANVLTTKQTVGPRNETEQSLAAIWAELLKLANVGIHDDFFELGGHSLLAIKVMSRIRDVFEVELPLQALFENSTVAGLAALVSEANGSEGSVEMVQRIERRKETGPSPLSFAQEQMWFLDQLVPGSPAYNIVDVIVIRGEYNAQAMKSAMRELLRRHETLRTGFSRTGGQLAQIIVPTVDLPLPEVDLSSLPDEERDREWMRVVRAQGRKAFDLSQAPLLRATVVHTLPQEHKLFLTIHHVIADEWTMEVIQTEVSQLYAAFSRGQPSPLPELAIQYADFACWQRDWLQGEVLDAQVAYWKSELAGASPVLALPTDKPRPATPSFRGATELFTLPKALLEKLHALGRSEQATPFMILEAAFAALLNRYSGQADILVGTPISGRTHSETERLVGCFLNTVVLRSQFSDRMTFRSLLQQARRSALGAYAHSDLPFERLVATIAPQRDPSRTPLFQVMFILHDPDGVSVVSRVAEYQKLETGTSKFDLTLYVSETKAGLECLMEYSTDLFEAESIRRLCRHYGVLLQAVARDLDQSISKLPMLADADRQQLLVEWNNTAVVYPGGEECLHQLFERQVERTRGDVAVVCGRDTLTYGELDRRSNQLAHHLMGLGVGPDVLVGLCVERSLEMVVALLGILKAGGAYVPLDPAFPADRLAYMVSDSKMRVLITHRDLDKTLRQLPPAVVRLDRDWEDIGKHGVEAPTSQGLRQDHLAYVLYTSGSTGMPKGVAITHSAIVNFLLSMQREPGLTAGDCLLAVTTLSFDIAGLELYLPLVSGAKVVIASRDDAMDPQRLMERLRESACTVMQATPATWRALINAGWHGSPGLRALCGGEALPPDLAQALLPRCAELWNMYGPTETTVWSTVHKITSADGQAPIGRPIGNTQTYVLDADRGLVPPGVVGELYIGGAGLARGYLHRAELTRERFVQSPFAPDALIYRTGDLARWHADGVLECLGRTDYQVKVRGYRIELGEIEAALLSVPGVREAVVTVATQKGGGEPRLVAYWVGEAERQTLFELVRDRLPHYMIPTAYVRLPSLPLTANGKIDRKALPSAEANEDAPVAMRLPSNETEERVAELFSEVLGISPIGIDQDFFELGGTSVLVVRARERFEQEFGVELPLAVFFRTPTVSALAAQLGPSATAAEPSGCLVQLKPGHGKRALFLIHDADGEVLLYRNLAMRVPQDVAVYGVVPLASGRVPMVHVTIEEMAAHYVTEIRARQPSGPYYLGGLCAGGVIAFEVARRLVDAGERIALLALIEAISPTAPLRPLRVTKERFERSAALLRNVHSLGVFHAAAEGGRRLTNLARYEAENRRNKLVASSLIFLLEHHLDSGFAWPSWLPVPSTRDIYMQAAARYTPRPVEGVPAVLVRATEGTGSELPGIAVCANPDLGWSAVFGGDLQMVDSPGGHSTLLQEPRVEAVAQYILPAFEPATPRARSAATAEPVEKALSASADRVVTESTPRAPQAAQAKHRKSVLVVTVSYRTAALVAKLLASIEHERRRSDALVVRAVIIDNASGDAAALRRGVEENHFQDWVTVIESDRNGGYAYGNNLGFRHAYESGQVPDFFFLLNPDTEVRAGAFEELVRFFQEQADAGIASSSLENDRGDLFPYAFRFPSLVSEVEHALGVGVVSTLLKDKIVARRMGTIPEEVDWAPGAALMLRREVIDELGGMDEGYFLYFEETDFCRKVKQAGWGIWYVPQSRVMHMPGQSTGVTTVREVARRLPDYWYESRRRYFAKQHGLPYAVATDAVTLAAYLVGRGKLALQGRGQRAVPHYLADLARHSPILVRNRELPPAREFHVPHARRPTGPS